jgi:hypothetical protein
MDFETANELNEALKPFGYTVGKIHLELKQYEAAIEIANTILKDSNLTDEEYKEKKEKIKVLEAEFREIECAGKRDVSQSRFHYKDMIYTESEEDFWKYHSMGCGFTGKWKRKQVQPGNPVTFKCPVCGSAYMPEQKLDGPLVTFVGNSIAPYTRSMTRELIVEMIKRGYRVEKNPDGFWKEE